MTTEFSHRIIELPLFLGLSQSEITAIMGHTRFGFTQVAEGMPVVKEHDACSHLYFLRKGTLRVETVADDHGYRLVEEVGAPTLLQPEHLFGLHQHYTSTFTAQTDCQFITLEKSEVIRLTTEFTIFRLNFFNLLTTRIQKRERTLWHTPSETLAGRITRFISARCQDTKGKKTLYIKMTRLAEELNDSRLDISHALNDMQANRWLTLHRGRIQIPQLELLPK